MIRIINSSNQSQFSRSLEQQFRLRHDVFVTELGWCKPREDLRETDQYDTDDAIYVTSIDGRGDVVGGFRLCPTTAPHMLGEHFAYMVEGPVLERADVLEATRFAVASDRRSGGETYRELYLGMLEYCLSEGIIGTVGVVRTVRLTPLLGLGMSVRPIGLSRMIGTENNTAIYWDINEEVLARVRQKAGVTGTVLERDGAAFSRVA